MSNRRNNYDDHDDYNGYNNRRHDDSRDRFNDYDDDPRSRREPYNATSNRLDRPERPSNQREGSSRGMFSSRSQSGGGSGNSHRKQTRDYRFQLTRDLLTNLHRGECCAVVGVGSCGKSRLLLHLARPETLDYHLGDGADNQLIVTVQCNAFQGTTPWHAYEGIASDLWKVLEESRHPAVERARPELVGLYDAVVNSPDIAFKHLMTGIGYLLGNSRLKLTLCFDEFDFVFEKFDAQLFRNLRALRNANKYQLTYLLATRKQLPYQRDPATWEDVEEFYELFTDNTFAIGPYDERDAIEMVTDLENRYEFKLKKPTRDLLLWVTGRHSGLIGASFRHLEAQRLQPTTDREIEQALVNEQTTWKECRKIWDSLLKDERNALRRLANNQRLQRDGEAAIPGLKAKGLVVEVERRGVINFSPIFHEFARQQDEER